MIAIVAQQPAPDSPFGDYLGYLVLFVVVIWPILRGVIESANQRRREFEARQPKPRAGRQPFTIEDLLEDDPRPRKRSAEERRYEQAQAPSTPPPRPPATDVSYETAESRYDTSVEDSYDDESLVGDPFDERSMGGQGMGDDLVPDADLDEVPSEDELEGTSAQGEVSDRISERKPAVTLLASPTRENASLVALERIEERLTPWQRAIALQEIMGRPAALRPYDTARF